MKRFVTVSRTALTIAAFVLLELASSNAQPVSPVKNGSAPIFMNPQLPTDVRVNDLISRMTLEEKASQMVNQARPIPRLGVPGYNWWNEALHGVARSGLTTVFPEPIGLGATFNPPLIHKMATVISTEARVKYNIAERKSRDHQIYQGLTFWSPNINIFRDPRWGRGQETYGEDPFLTGQMGKAFVTGMQGDDPKYLKVVATPKHYAVHSGPEPTRHEVDIKVSKHDERDTYLPAFREAVVDGKAESVMCAYNSINGQPACANDFLLMETLRNAWNFKGYMVSDCDAIADIADGLGIFMSRGHHYTKDVAEAAAVSVKAGVDNDCADFSQPREDNSDYQRYIDAVKQGLLPEKDLDASLTRLFVARMKLGMFDPPQMVKYTQVPDSELDSDANRQLALQTARESMVLLKNDGVLPLKAGQVKTIAVVGPLANQTDVLYGNYNGFPSRTVTVLDGIKKQFPNANVVFEPGTNFLLAVGPIPSHYLTTDDGQQGLRCEFFDNAKFSGTPILSHVDANVDYDLDRRASLPNTGQFSVRWTGFLTPDTTDTYKIGLDSRSGRLWIDGKLVVDISNPRQRAPKTILIRLEAGHKYAVKIERDLGPGLSLKFDWVKQVDNPLPRAIAAAKKADVVVAVVGITSQLEGEEMNVDVPGFLSGDRTSLDIPKDEEDVLKVVRATGKPLIVVLMNGSALSVNWAAKNASAILEAWYSGEEGGTAIAQTLSGANNPAGRLPVTFYTGVKQLPPFVDYSMANRTYRYFKGKPLYPFGYGLSYSKFAYGGLKLSIPAVKAGDPLGVDVDVKNVSKLDGDEVAQLYLAFPNVPGTPIRALRGLQRVHLKASETQRLHFDLKPRDLSSVTEAGDIVVQTGDYALSVGGGQRGATKAIVAAGFKIDGELKLPE